jgi:hypothetical protein
MIFMYDPLFFTSPFSKGGCGRITNSHKKYILVISPNPSL